MLARWNRQQSATTPKPRFSYITARSYKNDGNAKFIDDLASAPFHIADIFDDLDDQVHVLNSLFWGVLSEHAPLRRVKIKSRPNPYYTPDIRQLMRTRDKWHKKSKFHLESPKSCLVR